MQDHTFPDFLIVGAAKSGTSSLHLYLDEHPGVVMPRIKETWFWHQPENPNRAMTRRNPKLPVTLDQYSALYDRRAGAVYGEATPSYLYYHQLTIDKLKRLHPNWEALKIIIILREPISKIKSHYRFARQKNLDPEQLSLAKAIAAEERRLAENEVLLDMFYVDNTRYAAQVKAYIDNFPNVKIYLYEDLRERPEWLIQDLYRYIGVDDTFTPPSLGKRVNKSRSRVVPRNWFAARYNGRLRRYRERWGGAFRGIIDTVFFTDARFEPATLDHLKTVFAPEVAELERVIGRDLTHWREQY